MGLSILWNPLVCSNPSWCNALRYGRGNRVGHTIALHPHEHAASGTLDTVLLRPALKKTPAIILRKRKVQFTSPIVPACSVPATLFNKSPTSVRGEGKIWTHSETLLQISASTGSSLWMTLAPMCLLPILPYPGVSTGCEACEGLPQNETLNPKLAGGFQQCNHLHGKPLPWLSLSFQVLPGSVCVQAMLMCSLESVSATAQ